MKKIYIVFYVIGLIVVFLGGMWWQHFVYTDICLDMGGGLNPGNYSICVLEKNIPDKNPNRQDGVYFCDEKGNKFISKEEAYKYGLKDNEFGATFCPAYLKEIGM